MGAAGVSCRCGTLDAYEASLPVNDIDRLGPIIAEKAGPDRSRNHRYLMSSIETDQCTALVGTLRLTTPGEVKSEEPEGRHIL
jgi:hypothetical protein